MIRKMKKIITVMLLMALIDNEGYALAPVSRVTSLDRMGDLPRELVEKILEFLDRGAVGEYRVTSKTAVRISSNFLINFEYIEMYKKTTIWVIWDSLSPWRRMELTSEREARSRANNDPIYSWEIKRMDKINVIAGTGKWVPVLALERNALAAQSIFLENREWYFLSPRKEKEYKRGKVYEVVRCFGKPTPKPGYYLKKASKILIVFGVLCGCLLAFSLTIGWDFQLVGILAILIFFTATKLNEINQEWKSYQQRFRYWPAEPITVQVEPVSKALQEVKLTKRVRWASPSANILNKSA